jgi:RNase H-fold protein (predicted Holliday junction resolvase)
LEIRKFFAGVIKKKERQDRSVVDKVSAAIILQSFLDRRSKEREKKN